MKYGKEIRLGFIITVALAILVWGLNFLKGNNILFPSNEYYAIYNRVDGLAASNPVQINGYVIGQVKKIYFYPGAMDKIVVKISVSKKDVNLPKGTRAKIYSEDLMGSKSIELILGTDTSYLNSGDTLATEIEEDLKASVNRQIAPLKEKTEQLLSSVDSAVMIVQQILNKDARETLSKGFKNIKRSFENFENVSANLDQLVGTNKDKLNDIFTKIQSIVTNFNNNNEELSNVINNLSAISDSVAKADFASTLVNVNKALNTTSDIMNKINKGEGTLGLLLNDTKLYNELTMAATDLNILLLDVRSNPGKYAPLKRRRKEQPLERDSVFYEHMMKMDSFIINYNYHKK